MNRLIMMEGKLETGYSDFKHLIKEQQLDVEDYKLKAAMYKAFFFHRHSLGEKLQAQVRENLDARVGEFDGWVYASWRAKAIYRTLEDMVRCGLISLSEYDFCQV